MSLFPGFILQIRHVDPVLRRRQRRPMAKETMSYALILTRALFRGRYDRTLHNRGRTSVTTLRPQEETLRPPAGLQQGIFVGQTPSRVQSQVCGYIAGVR